MSSLLRRKSTKGKTLDLSGKKLSSLDERLKSEAAIDTVDASNNFLKSVSFATLSTSFVNLANLDLSKNALTVLGPELGQLVQLTRLNVSNNALTELPRELGALTQLRKLVASRNALRSLPAEMVNLRELSVLQLQDNALVELPPWLLQLRDSLKELAYDGNPLLSPSLLYVGKDAGVTPLLWASLERLAALRELHYVRDRFALTTTARKAFEERIAGEARLSRLFSPILSDAGVELAFEMSYSISQQQNWRAYQEDRFVCIPQVDVRDVLSDRVLPPYYPPLWDDAQKLYEKELAIHQAIIGEYEREARGEDVDSAKDKWIKERDRQRKETLKARKEGIYEEHDEEESIEEQRTHIAKVEGWHRLHLEPQYPLHLDARSHSPAPPAALAQAGEGDGGEGQGVGKGEGEGEGESEGGGGGGGKASEAVIKEHSALDSMGFFAVFDGHGGDHCSDYLQHNLHVHLFNNKELVRSAQWSKALTETFATCERLFLAESRARNFSSGSTACVALLVNAQLWVANCGDSRAVLCRRDKAYALSRDHKPTLKDEKKRIEEAGGFVENSAKTGYTARVQGILAMSRSIGDIQCKEPVPAVSAEPEISETFLGLDDAFILIASDGLYDAMSSQDAVDYIRKSTEKHRVAQELAERALKDSKDNVTVMIVWLFWSATGLTSKSSLGVADQTPGIVLGKDRIASDVLHKRARSASHLTSSGDGSDPVPTKHRKKSDKKASTSTPAFSESATEEKPTEKATLDEAVMPPKAQPEAAEAPTTEQSNSPAEVGQEKNSALQERLGSVERRHSLGSMSPKTKSPAKDRKRGVLVTSASAAQRAQAKDTAAQLAASPQPTRIPPSASISKGSDEEKSKSRDDNAKSGAPVELKL